MKSYELTYIISPEIKTEELEGLISEISSFLQKEGGIIIKTEGPSPINLGYQIKKKGNAFQSGLEFQLAPEKLKNLEEKIKKDPKILRYFIILKIAPRKEKGRFKKIIPVQIEDSPEKEPKKIEKKVELKDIEEKLEEILKE